MSIIQKRILTGLALVTALVCAIAFSTIRSAFGLAPTSTPTCTPRPDTGDEIDAIAMCKKFVKDRLIAPRDAKWPGLFDEQPTITQTGLDTWRVESWVDASNRLGVHIHTEYVCEVRYLGSDKWRLETLNLQEP